jgi:predicted nucleotidyltransferase
VLSLSLFGSTARDEAGEESDVDVDVAVRPEPIEGGFAYFGRLDRIERRLRKLLGTRVDVIGEPTSRPQIQQEIDRDRCLAF